MLSSHLKEWFQGDAGRLLCPWRKTSFIRRIGLLGELLRLLIGVSDRMTDSGLNTAPPGAGLFRQPERLRLSWLPLRRPLSQAAGQNIFLSGGEKRPPRFR